MNLVSKVKMGFTEKKTVWRWVIFIAFFILFLIITQNTMKKVLEEITEIPVERIIMVIIAGAGYQLMDAWCIKDLANNYNPDFTFWKGIQCTYTAAFYRVITFGSGSGVAAMYFLERNGIEATGSVGIILLQYSIYKLAMGILCLFFYIAEYNFFQTNFSSYNAYIFAGLVVILIISFVLVLLSVSKLFHSMVLKLAKIVFRSKKGRIKLEKLETDLENMRVEGKRMLKQKRKLFGILVKNIIRILFWLLIPFILIYGKTNMTFLESVSVGGFAISLAGVIPTPAGLGSIEALMISFFGIFVGIIYGGSIVVMYRFSTYLLPGVIGFLIYLFKGNVGKTGR